MAFDYTSLFAASEQGGAWLATGTHYTTTARDVASSVDDPVGSLTDVSANAYHFRQTSGAQRPTLRQTANGKRFLDFGGTQYFSGNDTATSSTWSFLHQPGSASVASYVAIAFRHTLSNARGGLVCNGSNLGTSVGFTSSVDARDSISPLGNLLNIHVSRGTNPPSYVYTIDQAVAAGTDNVFEVVHAISRPSMIFLNGSYIGGCSTSFVSTSNGTVLALGAFGDLSSIFNGRIYATVVRNAIPTDEQRADILYDMSARTEDVPVVRNTIDHQITLLNRSGSPMANLSGLTVDIHRTNGELIAHLTGKTTSANGVLTLDPADVPIYPGETVIVSVRDNDVAGQLTRGHVAPHVLSLA